MNARVNGKTEKQTSVSFLERMIGPERNLKRIPMYQSLFQVLFISLLIKWTGS